MRFKQLVKRRQKEKSKQKTQKREINFVRPWAQHNIETTVFVEDTKLTDRRTQWEKCFDLKIFLIATLFFSFHIVCGSMYSTLSIHIVCCRQRAHWEMVSKNACCYVYTTQWVFQSGTLFRSSHSLCAFHALYCVVSCACGERLDETSNIRHPVANVSKAYCT